MCCEPPFSATKWATPFTGDTLTRGSHSSASTHKLVWERQKTVLCFVCIFYLLFNFKHFRCFNCLARKKRFFFSSPSQSGCWLCLRVRGWYWQLWHLWSSMGFPWRRFVCVILTRIKPKSVWQMLKCGGRTLVQCHTALKWLLAKYHTPRNKCTTTQHRNLEILIQGNCWWKSWVFFTCKMWNVNNPLNMCVDLMLWLLHLVSTVTSSWLYSLKQHFVHR